MRELKNIKPKRVSLVERPAIRKKFYIIKEEEKIMDDLLEILKAILEEEITEEQIEIMKALKPEAADALKKALGVLSKYIADYPDDVKKAIQTLTKHAAYGYPAPKKEEPSDAVEKKEWEEKNKELSEAIENGITDLKKKIEESGGETIKKMEEKLGDAGKVVKGLEDRLKKIEEIKAIKKSLEGQDDDTPPTDSKWPSFFGEGGGE